MNYKTRPEFHRDNEFILASMRRRFAAFFIDWIVLIIIYLSIITLLSLFNLTISNINVHGIFDVELEMENVHPYFITFLKFLFGLLPVFYFALSFYLWKGQTIGKYFLRIRVLSLYHERIGLWHSIERSLGYFASALEFGFGFIQAYWNPNRMSLHDKIGETVVVDRLNQKISKKSIVNKPAPKISGTRGKR
jgi:uncharacterized RDD family membrane protein YckC